MYLLYIVYCILYIVYCILYIVYCILYIVYCILYIVYCLVNASFRNKALDPSGHLYFVFVKSLFNLKYILMSALYAPAHEHSNALFMAVQRPTVHCCAAETLQMFVEGTRPFADLDDVGEAATGIVRQRKCR